MSKKPRKPVKKSAEKSAPKATTRARPPSLADAPLSVVVLAAGQGKRMKSALPKVLQPLAGRPLLGHVLDAARVLQPQALHIVYGHGGDTLRAAFKDQPFEWALQAEQLGTGHALMQALPVVPDSHVVLVLFGDVPLVRSEALAALVEDARANALALLSVELADPTGYGRVLRDKRGNVTRVVEQRDASATERRVRECNTGVLAALARLLRLWLARLRNANAQGEYYLTDIIAMAVKGRVPVVARIVADENDVLGVNDRRQLAQLEGALRARRAAQLLEAGVTLADPMRIDIRGEVVTGRDVFLDVGVVLEGRVELGDNVRVGPYCVLRDVTLGAGTEVAPHSVLTGAVAAENCVIGPFARLRPGARLAREVHVGNFVEVKNSELGVGSKANHLTYLGDTTVGTRVNVGAGTITCNYDGVNKSRTVIGDHAFIGSGTMLVAPVTVGADATIGAGSVITSDAPAGKLTLGRGRQATIEGWQRPVKGAPLKPRR
ncbi:MAG: bifunctional UDP-N-acetylglucosamine diphosphorylase/glucosamine-1-phosphate N-acetyltransferase GlmU [Ferruginibacter sp.]